MQKQMQKQKQKHWFNSVVPGGIQREGKTKKNEKTLGILRKKTGLRGNRQEKALRATNCE